MKAGIAIRGVLGMALLAASGAAAAQAIMTTGGDGELMVVFPAPGSGLPTPVQRIVPLPSGSIMVRPNAVSTYGADYALVTNIGYSRIRNVRLSTAQLLHSFDLPDYLGNGTIAVSPNGQYALAMGGTESKKELNVMRAPFQPGLQVHVLALPGDIQTGQSQAIVFDQAGRAFVHTTAGIQILDPPYVQIKSSIEISNGNVGNVGSLGGALAISPDGQTLLVTRLQKEVLVYRAPFRSSSLPAARISLPGNHLRLNGIKITPDGKTAIVVSSKADTGQAVAFSIRAPFSANASVTPLLSSNAYIGTFEDVDISPDGQLAILTGNSADGAEKDAIFIQAPFNANARVHRVQVGSDLGNLGRGFGAVRFLASGNVAPAPVLFADGFEP